MAKLPEISTFQIYSEKFSGLLASLETWYHSKTEEWRMGHKAYYCLHQVERGETFAHMIKNHEYSTQRCVIFRIYYQAFHYTPSLHNVSHFSLKNTNYHNPGRAKSPPVLYIKSNVLSYYCICLHIFVESSLQWLQVSIVKILWFTALSDYSIGDFPPLHVGRHCQRPR